MKWTVIAAVGALVVPVVRPALGDAASDRKQIEAGYKQVLKLINQRNVNALMKMCTPDCTFAMHGQTFTAQQAAAQMKQMMSMLKTVKASGGIDSCTVKGNTAVCITHQTLDGVMVGADKKPHKLHDAAKYKDTLVRSGKSWLLKHEDTLSEKGTLDGKPMPEEMPGAPAGTPVRKK